jgi:AcrR family transcriptional regulator
MRNTRRNRKLAAAAGRGNEQAQQRDSVTINEICARNDLSRPTVFKEIRLGRLIVREIGRKRVALISDYQAWLANLPRRPPIAPRRMVAAVKSGAAA